MPLTLILSHINHNANGQTRLLDHDDMNNIYKDLKIIQSTVGILFQCIYFFSSKMQTDLFKPLEITLPISFDCKKHKNLKPI